VKRFWRDVSVVRVDGGWEVHLDDRPIKTPAKAALLVPTESLAEGIAVEWRSAAETVDPRAMPLTGLANAAIDRVAPDLRAFAGGLARYAEADLACYRAEWPPELVERQEKAWDGLLAWARRRYDVDFSTTSGLMHVPQPQATIERLAHEVSSLDALRLAAMSPLVSIGGSLVAALAMLEKMISTDEAWEAVSIDERWQLEQWGSDSEAELALENRKKDFFAAATFLRLLDQ
jgi:chaperone required for assembly of F1-ATPase